MRMDHRWTHKASSTTFVLRICNVFAAGTVTKLDWLAWTAAVGDAAQRQKLLQWVFALATSRGAEGGRVPMSDFYDVTTVRILATCRKWRVLRAFLISPTFCRVRAGGRRTVRGRGLLLAQCMR